MDRAAWQLQSMGSQSQTWLKQRSTKQQMHEILWRKRTWVNTYMTKWESESESRSVVSDCLEPQGLHSPWNSPGQNTGVGSLSLLQGDLPKAESDPRSPTLQVDSFFFLSLLLLLFICSGFCHTLKWNSHGLTCVPTSGHTHWGNQIWKRHVHPNVHHSTVYNNQNMEAT